MAATKVLNWTVYVLKCPRTRAVRYVGWTAVGIKARLGEHIRDSVRVQRTHKAKWVMSLVSIGLTPVMEIVENGTGDGWADAERRWIASYRASGARLVNGTDGGDGTPGWGTPEQRSELARKREDAKTPEQRSEATRKGNAAKTPEERSEAARKREAAKTPEERSAAARKTYAAAGLARSLTQEQRSARSRKSRATQLAQSTPEQRSAVSRKAAETRRAMRGGDHFAGQRQLHTPSGGYTLTVSGGSGVTATVARVVTPV